MTRVGRSTLRTWRARREGPPFIQLGARTPRYPRDELRRWIRERLSTFIVDNK
jgi:predicted DNA-binding transcriptional regulator AlpA